MDDTIEYMIYYIYISLWYYFQEYKIDYSIFFTKNMCIILNKKLFMSENATSIPAVSSYPDWEIWTEEMAQQIRTVISLPEDLGQIPRTHIVARNCLTLGPGDPIPFSGLHGYQSCKWRTDIHADKILRYRK